MSKGSSSLVRIYGEETHKFPERKIRGKWHVHTHLIVMNYDKFCFYDGSVFYFYWELEQFKRESLSRRVKEKSFQSFLLFMFSSRETQFCKTIKIIYYNPTSVKRKSLFIFYILQFLSNGKLFLSSNLTQKVSIFYMIWILEKFN